MSQENDRQLPDGWQWVKLGDVCEQDKQIIEPKTPLFYNLTYLSLEHIASQTGKILKSPCGEVEDEGISTTFAFNYNHVLYGKLRPYLNKVAVPDFEGRCTTELIPLLPQQNIDRLFLAWLLRCKDTVEKAMQGKTGSRMPRANMQDLLELKIPLPPLSEQKRIAAILNEQMEAVEKARKATEAQLEAAKALPAAYLRAVFESEEANSWEIVKLGKHTTKIGSGITPRGGQSSYLESGIPLIRSQNVYTNRFKMEGLAYISQTQDELMEASRVFTNDVLLNITGASIGRVCVVPPELCPANVNQHVSIIRSNRTWNSYYIAYYLSNPNFQKFILDSQSGATRQALTKEMIENFKVPFPPLPKQKQIASTLTEQMQEVERLKQNLKEQLDTINKLPAVLLRRAFKGEL